jgi:sensor domain CHASE-containing protein
MIFLTSFATLEEQDTNKNIERVHSALLVELTNLDTYTYDWAAWDDTYAFIQDVNEDYIESNLLDETFIASELNLMLFVNSSGGIVFGKAFDLENEEEISLPETLHEHLSPKCSSAAS